MFFCGRQWTSQCLTQQSRTAKDTEDTWRSTHLLSTRHTRHTCSHEGQRTTNACSIQEHESPHNLSVWMRERLDMDGRAKWKVDTGGREIFYLVLTFECHLWIVEGHMIKWHFLLSSQWHTQKQTGKHRDKLRYSQKYKNGNERILCV